MKIKTSNNLNRLNRWEVFQFIADVMAFANTKKESMPALYQASLAELKTKFDAFDQALITERNFTPEGLIEAEEARDYAIRKLSALIDMYADYRPDNQKQKAAQALQIVFKPYGSGREIAMMPQDSETATITNLLQELKKTDAASHLATLDLQPLVEYLEGNNIFFEKKQQARRDEKSQYITGLVKTTRDEAKEAFFAFCETVNALSLVEGEAAYSLLIGQINTLTDTYLSKANMRYSKNK